jgi:TRAP-type C4-dicarboxylate transport system permease small subunit
MSRTVTHSTAMDAIVRNTDRINKVLGWVAGIFMAVASVAVFAQVFIRFVIPLMGMSVSAPWTEELARYLMIWVVFLGVAVLSRTFRLIAVEMIVVALPERAGIVMRMVSVSFCILFFLTVAIVGFGWTSMSGIETSPVMRLPMTWVYMAMPVGALIAIFNLLVFAAEILTGRRRNVEPTADMMD